jgi:hypothetical protein
MGRFKCPGQDSRYWKPNDISQSACANCGYIMEFFKDDMRRRCPQCNEYTVNPKNDLGCAVWCKSGPSCLAQLGRSEPQEDLAISGQDSETEL